MISLLTQSTREQKDEFISEWDISTSKSLFQTLSHILTSEKHYVKDSDQRVYYIKNIST